MTSTGAPLLSWGWLSHSGDESEHVLLLSARPILDRLRDVRRLDAFTPRQIGNRERQLQHPVTLALALQVPVYARALRFIARPQPLHGRAQVLAAGLVHRAVVAHLRRAHVGVGGEAGALRVLRVLHVGEAGRLSRSRRLHPCPDRAERRPPMAPRGARCRCDRRELLERHARHLYVAGNDTVCNVDAVEQRARETFLVAADQG
jgi:hypothetical protein